MNRPVNRPMNRPVSRQGNGCTVAAMALALFAPACVSGAYNADSLYEPIVSERLEALRPGHDTLATCLQALGAPNRVLEYHVEPDGSSGMALLWFWRDAEGWGIELSSPADEVPASVAYSAAAADLPGCVLWFGADLVLELWRVGPIGELLPGRVRPSVSDA